MADRRGLRVVHGETLTTGKQRAQGKSLPEGSYLLTCQDTEERKLLLRWFGLLLYLSDDISSHADQFKKILSLPR